MTYAALADRVDELAGPRSGRLHGSCCSRPRTTSRPSSTLLAALAGGHPVIVTAPGESAPGRRLGPGRRRARRRCSRPGATGSAHDLHPDLALLLSTSGSTGSPKLVRLSADNLDCNAGQIADALGLRADDVAATTLPLQYCYGLSVLLSHLSVGAGVLLTDLSVVDACFWEAFREAGGTTLAGVPYTFDLLDAVGFASMALPRLRLLTQAGGRMDPAAGAALGRARRGARLRARSSCTARPRPPPGWPLSPRISRRRTRTSIGVAVRGGHFRLEPVDGRRCRRRRARLRGRQRDDGLRLVAGRPRPRARGRRAAHR